jgi:hypothetical protein
VVNLDIIRRRLKKLDEHLRFLYSYQSVSKNDFLRHHEIHSTVYSSSCLVYPTKRSTIELPIMGLYPSFLTTIPIAKKIPFIQYTLVNWQKKCLDDRYDFYKLLIYNDSGSLFKRSPLYLFCFC